MPVTSRDLTTPAAETPPNWRVIAGVVLAVILGVLALRACFPPADARPSAGVPTAAIVPSAQPTAPAAPALALAAPTTPPAAPVAAAPSCPTPAQPPANVPLIFLARAEACPGLVLVSAGADTIWVARPPDLADDILKLLPESGVGQ